MDARFRGDRRTFAERLRELVGALAGERAPEELRGIVLGLYLRIANSVLSNVQQAFVVKSRGGVGSDGIKWPALKRSTIAQRRLGKGEKKALGIGGRRVRGLLTPAEDKKWRQIFGTRLASLLVKGVPPGEAKGIAASIAWAELKKDGAKTKLDVLGSRQVDMLRDTSELFRSLQPGVGERESNADGQIIELQEGSGYIVVGTNKKPWHHAGVPGKLPARPLWPLDGSLPEPWAQAASDALTSGMPKAIMLLARGG